MTARPFEREDFDEHLRHEAAEWLARLNGDLTGRERQAFEQWLDADLRHPKVLAELQENVERLRQLRRHVAIPPGRPDPDLLVRGPARRSLAQWALAPAAIAAGIALLIALGPFASRPSPERTGVVAAYETHASGFERIELKDGSVVELNKSTRLEVAFTSDRRQVRLISGEAHFNVAKDSSRPFVVETGRVTVQAVGTAFNVRATEGEIRVLVTEGRIALSTERRPQLSTTAHNASEPRIPGDAAAYLGLGEQAVVDVTAATVSPRIAQLERAQIEKELAWTGPRLLFQGTPLSEAVRQFNEHNALQVELGDDAVGRMAIGGSFAAKDVDAFLRLLSRYENIVVERAGDGRAVVRRRAP